MEAKEAYLPVVAMATGVVLMAAEVRRMGRERDAARKEFEGLVARLAERPETVFLPHRETPPVSPEPAYISDLPYHDELWNEFTTSNEALTAPEEDDE